MPAPDFISFQQRGVVVDGPVNVIYDPKEPGYLKPAPSGASAATAGYRTVVSDTAVTVTDKAIYVNAASGDVTVTIPAGYYGEIAIMRTDNSASDVEVVATGRQINNSTDPFPITTQYEGYVFKPNGTTGFGAF